MAKKLGKNYNFIQCNLRLKIWKITLTKQLEAENYRFIFWSMMSKQNLEVTMVVRCVEYQMKYIHFNSF